jgi:hypothetical protein
VDVEISFGFDAFNERGELLYETKMRVHEGLKVLLNINRKKRVFMLLVMFEIKILREVPHFIRIHHINELIIG